MTLTAQQRKELRETNPFDPRNVVDSLKHRTTEELQRYMNDIGLPFVAVCVNLVGDFNISQIVRSANAFGLQGVVVSGNRKWDRRGAVGAHHYIDVTHASDIFDVIADFQHRGYAVIAAEYSEKFLYKSESLYGFGWPDRVAVIFGEEGSGLSDEVLEAVDRVVYIRQRGTVRSLNVASCAAVMMNSYVNSDAARWLEKNEGEAWQ